MLRTGRTRTLLKIILRSSLTSRLLIKKVLSTVWDTQFIQFPTPRQQILHGAVKKLAFAEGHNDEFDLYERVERLAPKVIGRKRKIYKGVAANVDFYSGLLYSLLDIPCELYTPLFATARITGWSAHRLEELINCGKIIRPAYMSISENKEYVDLKDR